MHGRLHIVVQLSYDPFLCHTLRHALYHALLWMRSNFKSRLVDSSSLCNSLLLYGRLQSNAFRQFPASVQKR